MNPGKTIAAGLAMAVLATAAAAREGEDAAEKELGWFDTAELSLVATDGNAESTTVRLANVLRRVWPEAVFKLEASGLRAQTSTRSRRAVRAPDGEIRILDRRSTEVTAEQYALRGRYQHQISQRVFWYTGAGWERNEPAGVADRVSAAGGVGNRWVETDDALFTTDYAVTFTDETPVAGPAPDPFLGFRATLDAMRRLTDTALLTGSLIVDENLDDTDDLRAEGTAGLAVTMSERLALKVSVQLAYDNQPSLVLVPLELPDGAPAGGEVAIPLEKLDSQLHVTLVVDF